MLEEAFFIKKLAGPGHLRRGQRAGLRAITVEGVVIRKLTKRKSRSERKKEDVRQAVLDSARVLFIKAGYGNVPIRRIASQIGYSAAALYRYFPTKDDIFNVLTEEGLQLLRASETAAIGPPGSRPLDRLRDVIVGVFDFAKRYPEYFYLLFLDRSTPRLKLESLRAYSGPMRPFMGEILDECVAAGELEPGLDPWSVYSVIWTSMQGLAAQYVCDRLPPFDPDNYARVMADLVIAGLKGGALNGVKLFDDGCPPMPFPRKKR
jgi:AcrR family transcriptional regulator